MTQQSSIPGELVGDTNMAAVPLFRDTTVAAVTSHENTLLWKDNIQKAYSPKMSISGQKNVFEILAQLCSCDNDLSLFTACTEVSKWSIFAIVQNEMFHVNPRVNEMKRFIFRCWLRGTLKKSEWPSAGVEPTTFRLLVWMLCPWAIGN